MLPRSAQFTGNNAWVENMDNMTHLHEAAILDNLRQRFGSDMIYTCTGPILIAINPYKELPLYTDDIVKKYHSSHPGSVPRTATVSRRKHSATWLPIVQTSR